MYEQIFGAVHPILATKFHSLGLAYHSLFQRLSQRIQFHDTATRVLADMPESPEKAANLESLQDRLLTDVEGARVEQSNYLSSSINMIRQSIIVSERTIGLDSHATCQSYTDLAVLELSIGNPMAALRISKHAINLWASLHGARHPAILKALVRLKFLSFGSRLMYSVIPRSMCRLLFNPCLLISPIQFQFFSKRKL